MAFIRRVLLFTVILSCLAAPAAAALRTFYVDPAGNDGAAGSEAAPWRTLQRAANAVRAGDLVIVRAGHYAGFDLRASGTAIDPIEFRADTGVVIDTRNPVTPDGINLEGASWVIVQGFTVTGIPRAGIRSVTNHHVTIRGNTGDSNGYWGILTGFSDDLLIEDNEMSRSQEEHGIYVSNSGDRPIVRRNHVWGNRANGIHMNGDRFQGGDGVISGALVEANVIHDNGAAGGSAINCDGVQTSRFINNLIYGNHAGGITLYQIDGGQPSRDNVVAHNTILQASDGRWAINITDAATGNTVLNNILYNAHSFRGSLTVSADSLSGLVSDWNAVMNRFSTNDGDTRLTLAQWQSATGQDVHSFVATPAELFVDVNGHDYHLSADSPARDAGTAVTGVTTDLDGVPRPSGPAPDIGAYEAPVDHAMLSVTRRGSAAGTVTSDPPGIACGSTCAAAFDPGSTVTLTAVPDDGASFARWTGACSGMTATCVLTVSGSPTATAIFAQPFTDSTLVPGSTPVRAVHVVELRAALAALSAWRGMAAPAWTDPVLTAGLTTIRALHLTELRQALDAIYVHDGLAPPDWGPVPVASVSPVTAAHIEELRTSIRAVE